MSPFPLPLTPFEYAMLVDDRPGFPMTFRLRLRFDGLLDPTRFRDAACDALDHHPLLRGRVYQRGTRRPGNAWWDAAAPHQLPIESVGPEAVDHEGRIDPSISPGWHVRLVQGSTATVVDARFHHAYCDALGALRFLETLLERYAVRTPPQPDLSWLARRGQLGVSWGDHLRRFPYDVRRIRDFFTSRPRPLVARSPKRPTSCTGASRHVHVFDTTETSRLRMAAKRAGATLNDLLLRDLFLALCGWSSGTARVAVATNLRVPSDRPGTAANVVSMVFIDRNPGRFATPTHLLRSLAAEMRTVRERRMGLTLLRVLSALGAVPGGIDFLHPPHRCLSTAVFSNLGVVFAGSPLTGSDGLIRVDGATLTDVEFFPPFRPHTHAAFGAVGYGGRLTLCLNANVSALPGGDAVRLLSGWVEEVRRNSH